MTLVLVVATEVMVDFLIIGEILVSIYVSV